MIREHSVHERLQTPCDLLPSSIVVVRYIELMHDLRGNRRWVSAGVLDEVAGHKLGFPTTDILGRLHRAVRRVDLCRLRVVRISRFLQLGSTVTLAG